MISFLVSSIPFDGLSSYLDIRKRVLLHSLHEKQIPLLFYLEDITICVVRSYSQAKSYMVKGFVEGQEADFIPENKGSGQNAITDFQGASPGFKFLHTKFKVFSIQQHIFLFSENDALSCRNTMICECLQNWHVEL